MQLRTRTPVDQNPDDTNETSTHSYTAITSRLKQLTPDSNVVKTYGSALATSGKAVATMVGNEIVSLPTSGRGAIYANTLFVLINRSSPEYSPAYWLSLVGILATTVAQAAQYEKVCNGVSMIKDGLVNRFFPQQQTAEATIESSVSSADRETPKLN